MLFDLMCYTCLNKDKHDLLDIQKHGKDLIPFKQKLMECLPINLVELSAMKMCRTCIRHLRITYKFLKMLQSNQESLKQLVKQETIIVKTETSYNINEDTKESVQIEEGAYITENNSCTLPDDVKSNLEDTVIFSCEKCSDCYTNLEESEEHICENKEFVMKFDEELNETVTCDANSNEKKPYKHLEKCLKCALCDYVLETRPQLKKHMRQVHSTDMVYFCSFCSKGFKQLYHLREHISMHTVTDNASYHSQKIEKPLSSSWGKVDIPNWLTSKEIQYDEDMVRHDAFRNVTPTTWQKCIHHVIKEESRMKHLYTIIDNVIEPFIIRVGEHNDCEDFVSSSISSS
ncbi:zinc finger c2h2 type [Holotrichia oblita]|uniref:Zinc finger c2h2 type n=1 Tax=Holotrichia oblita TaxID=644536 RepID=A0ACB9TGH9_HOLOL|nr:zinc finger c2h2 type [Holotrichia oblita]